jgi:CBS domain-containing protein
MKIQEIMTPKVKIARPNESLQCAARAMRSLNVGALPVCDGERLVGMVTDRDITVRAVAEGTDPTHAPVSESMTPDVVYCFQDQDAHEVERMMQEKQIRRLPVLDRAKQLVGIVSLGDLATKTHEPQMVGETLERVSEPCATDGNGDSKDTSRWMGPPQ